MNRTMKKTKVLDIDKDSDQTLDRPLFDQDLSLGPVISLPSSGVATILLSQFSENPPTRDI